MYVCQPINYGILSVSRFHLDDIHHPIKKAAILFEEKTQTPSTLAKMNTVQRFQLSEEDLENESNNATPPLPILNRVAGVVVDADNAAHAVTTTEETGAKNDTQESSEENVEQTKQKSPVVVIVVGMAGSGKSTLMAQLQRSLRAPLSPSSETEEKEDDDEDEEDDTPKRIGYCLNLDPATKLMPFAASIDIRDTVDYKEVMLQHQLGPNGAIMTSLNLFATKFDQVIQILEQRAFAPQPSTPKATDTSNTPISPDPNLDFILVDTPGQIEAFTWSASGTIMTSALASSFPTILAFVVDTPRCASSPSTFMSNMLYACSMLYRTRLPVLIVFNKTDVVPHDFCVDWMTNYESFQEALEDFADSSESGYYGSLTRSLSLMLDEFYSTLTHVGVSAATGEGVDEFWVGVEKAAREFETGYLEDLKGKMEEQEVKKRVVHRESMRRLNRDLKQQQQQR